VEFGIENSSSNCGRGGKEDRSNYNNGNSPSGKEVRYTDDSLLVSVGEVVVSGGHEVFDSSGVLLVKSSIKISGCCIEFLAVLVVILVVGIGVTVDLVQSSERVSQRWRIEEGRISSVHELRVFEGGRSIIGDLNDVASVGLVLSFSSISSGVVIATHPLEVDVISLSDFQVVGNKVIFDGWIGLDDVSSLSSDVQIVNSSVIRNSRWSFDDSERVTSVLEGSSMLSSVKGQSQVDGFNRDGGVVSQDSDLLLVVVLVLSVISERISESDDIIGGNVVSDSENARAVSVNARFILRRGEGPVVVSSLDDVVQVSSISQLIFSHLGCFEAFGCGSSVGLKNPSGSLDLSAIGSVQFGWFGASGKETNTSSLNISGFLLVIRAESEVVGQNGYIDQGLGAQ